MQSPVSIPRLYSLIAPKNWFLFFLPKENSQLITDFPHHPNMSTPHIQELVDCDDSTVSGSSVPSDPVYFETGSVAKHDGRWTEDDGRCWWLVLICLDYFLLWSTASLIPVLVCTLHIINHASLERGINIITAANNAPEGVYLVSKQKIGYDFWNKIKELQPPQEEMKQQKLDFDIIIFILVSIDIYIYTYNICIFSESLWSELWPFWNGGLCLQRIATLQTSLRWQKTVEGCNGREK